MLIVWNEQGQQAILSWAQVTTRRRITVPFVRKSLFLLRDCPVKFAYKVKKQDDGPRAFRSKLTATVMRIERADWRENEV
jgi:hypothetical protein